MRRRFEAIVFDNDGLLLDTEHAWTRAETALFERHGETFTAGHKRELIGTSVVESAAKVERMLGPARPWQALMDELHELVMEEAAGPACRRGPGALELLAAVRAPGYRSGSRRTRRASSSTARCRSRGSPTATSTWCVSAEDVELAEAGA